MGNTTDKIKESIKDTAGAVKRGTEKVKDARRRVRAWGCQSGVDACRRILAL
jgi:hypothetical protein